MGALLVRHLIESTLLCLLLGAIAASLQRQRAAVRHALWLIGVSKLLAPTFLLTATGAQLAFLLPATAWISYLAARASALLLALFGNWPSHLFTDAIQNGFHPLLALWLLGSTVMFAGWFIRLGQSRYMLMPAGSEEKEALERARQTFGFTAGIEIGLSRSSNEPSLVGLFRPAITIPQGLRERLSSMEYNAVLLHELAHARRRDNLSSAFVHAVACIFWFHPLLWFAEKRLISERERACDEAVIRCGITPRTYIAALVKVC